MRFLETDRLFLRNVAAKDADIMYDYRNNEICARYQRGQTKDYDGIVALVERRKSMESRAFGKWITPATEEEIVQAGL